MKNVRHTPTLKKNLISLDTLDEMGYSYKGEHGQLKMCRDSLVYFKSILKNGLYYLNATIEKNVVLVSHQEKNVNLLHRNLGHISERGLKELSNRKIIGDSKPNKLSFCDHCIFGKMKKVKFTPKKTQGM